MGTIWSGFKGYNPVLRVEVNRSRLVSKLVVPSRIVALIINHYPGVEIQIPFGSMSGILSTTVLPTPVCCTCSTLIKMYRASSQIVPHSNIIHLS